MKHRSLNEAVREIISAVADEDYPFLFVVGAGLAAPVIPLAPGIVALCREKLGAKDEPDPPGLDKLAEYSYWFEQAHPQPHQRQRFLHGLIAGKPIPAAALRLAHLLAEAKVARIALTPSFDESIERGLTLFGVDHVVCDHPATASRIDAERDATQIIHVHGTSWFYDCCNLLGEIDARADLGTNPDSMSALLDHLLSRRSPIVLGYSGWERDVLMSALRRRLANRLRYRLYWFCYRDDDAAQLPRWLVDHEDVIVITPSSSGLTADDGAGVSEALLPAQAVLEALIRGSELDAPRLTRDPIGFFGDLLEAQLGSTHDDHDIFQLREVVRRVRAVATVPEVDPLEPVRAAIRRSQAAEAIELAAALRLEDLTDAERAALLENLGGVLYDPTLSYDIQEKAARTMVQLASRRFDAHPADESVKQQWLNAMLHHSHFLAVTGSTDDALENVDTILERLENNPADDVIRLRALFQRASALGFGARDPEAIAAWSNYLDELPDGAPIEDRADGIERRALSHRRLGRFDEALADYGNALQLRESHPTEEIWALRNEVLCRANYAGTLMDLGRPEEAIPVFDRVIETYSAEPDEWIEGHIVNALVGKAVCLVTLGHEEEAVELACGVVAQYGESPNQHLGNFLTIARQICSADED